MATFLELSPAAGREVGAVKPVVLVVAVLALAAACTAGALRIRRGEVHREASKAVIVTVAVYFTVVFGLIAVIVGAESRS